MAVYVDAMVKYGVRRGRAGPRWCHMIADSPKELHAMAARIGLRRAWFQAKASVPHYDIGTERVRALAVALGAIECDRQTYVDHMRRIHPRRVASGPTDENAEIS